MVAAPEAVANLVEFSLLKSRAERAGGRIDRPAARRREPEVPSGVARGPARLMDLVRHTAGAQFTPAGVLRLPADGTGGRLNGTGRASRDAWNRWRRSEAVSGR